MHELGTGPCIKAIKVVIFVANATAGVNTIIEGTEYNRFINECVLKEDRTGSFIYTAMTYKVQ